MTFDQFSKELTDALPLIEAVAIGILTKLHFKNADAIVSSGDKLVNDTLAAGHGDLIKQLPGIIADAKVVGAALHAAGASPLAAAAAAPANIVQLTTADMVAK